MNFLLNSVLSARLQIPQSQNFADLTLQSEADDLGMVNVGIAIANSLSVVGCIFNLITAWILRTYHFTLGKMVVALSLMDLISSIISLFAMVKSQSQFFCDVQGFFWFFGCGGSLVWTVCFAHALFISSKFNSIGLLENMFKYYLWISTGVALILGIFAAIMNFFTIEQSVETCHHHTSPNKVDWSGLILMIIPTILALLCCGICYGSAMRKLRAIRGRRHLELILYPLLLIVCDFPAMALIIAIQINDNWQVPFWILFVSNFLLNSQGILNAIAYGLSRRIIEGYKNKFCPSEITPMEWEETFEEEDERDIDDQEIDRQDSTVGLIR